MGLYGSTRADELARAPWDQTAKQAFVVMQYTAQDTGYRAAYPDGRFLVVEEDGQPIGRLIVGDAPDGTVRVIDIALLPEHRAIGIGTALLHDVLAEADARGKPVSLHVERWNPAWRLYARLGFVEVDGSDDVHVLLQRPVGGS